MKITQAIVFTFLSMSRPERIILIVNICLFLSAINALIILPLIFNFTIIPGIEKKIGNKLEYNLPGYSLLPFRSYLAKYLEISLYILTKYFKIPKTLNPEYALVKARYQLAQFSIKEIAWSILSIFNMICFFLLLGLFALFNTINHNVSRTQIAKEKQMMSYYYQNSVAVKNILNDSTNYAIDTDSSSSNAILDNKIHNSSYQADNQQE